MRQDWRTVKRADKLIAWRFGIDIYNECGDDVSPDEMSAIAQGAYDRYGTRLKRIHLYQDESDPQGLVLTEFHLRQESERATLGRQLQAVINQIERAVDDMVRYEDAKHDYDNGIAQLKYLIMYSRNPPAKHTSATRRRARIKYKSTNRITRRSELEKVEWASRYLRSGKYLAQRRAGKTRLQIYDNFMLEMDVLYREKEQAAQEMLGVPLELEPEKPADQARQVVP